MSKLYIKVREVSGGRSISALLLMISVNVATAQSDNGTAIVFMLTKSCEEGLPILEGEKIDIYGTPRDEFVSIGVFYYLVEGSSGQRGVQAFDAFSDQVKEACHEDPTRTLRQVLDDVVRDE